MAARRLCDCDRMCGGIAPRHQGVHLNEPIERWAIHVYGLPKGNSGQMLTRARVTDMEGVVRRDGLPLGRSGGAPEEFFPDPASQLEVHWTNPLVPPW